MTSPSPTPAPVALDALCHAARSTLLLIDVQERLLPAIDDGVAVVRRCGLLARAAPHFGIPVIGTEQNPQGLGPNTAELRALCETTFEKFCFSAAAEPGLLQRLPAGRDTLVLAGCDAHVCVLQSAAGLLEAGYRIEWVADAVGSRRPADRDAATARARALGADIVTTEMVLFEWLGSSRHPAFREVLQLLR
jgi:nicotinamidase-related amidase